MKLTWWDFVYLCWSRPPRGGRGLKRLPGRECVGCVLSPPARGAWIETSRFTTRSPKCTSPPARGAWIETVSLPSRCEKEPVAPRAGGVD